MRIPVRAGLVLIAAVAMGAAGGVVGDRAWSAARSTAIVSDDALVDAMRREVGLTTEQEGRVREIVARHQHSVDSAWRAVRPNVHAAIGAAQMEIAMVLRPDQRDRYARWIRSAHKGVPGMTDSTR